MRYSAAGFRLLHGLRELPGGRELYLTTEERERFHRAVMRLEGHWIAVEGPRVVPGIPTPDESPVSEPHFLISLDGGPLAFCDPHGRWLQWLA